MGDGAPYERQQAYGVKYKYEESIIPPQTIVDDSTGITVTYEIPGATNILRSQECRFPLGAVGAGVRAVAATIKHEMRHREIFLEQISILDVPIDITEDDEPPQTWNHEGVECDNPLGSNPELLDSIQFL